MMQFMAFDSISWNHLIGSLPSPHLLQSWEWSQVKAKYGWQPLPFVWHAATGGQPVAAAMVLKRLIPVSGFARKLCLLYIPKGPIMDWGDVLLRHRVASSSTAAAYHTAGPPRTTGYLVGHDERTVNGR